MARHQKCIRQIETLPLTERRHLERVAAALWRSHTWEDSSFLPLFRHCQLSVLLSSSRHPVFYLLIPLPHPLLSSTRSPHHPHVRSLLPRYVLHSHQPDFLTRSFRSGTCFLFAAPTAELFKSCQSLEASALTSSSALLSIKRRF